MFGEGQDRISIWHREVEIEPTVRLECVPKFCYLGDTLGAEGVKLRQLDLGCNVLWLRLRSYLPFWQPMKHNIT